MKACPYCAEEIQDAAIVCRHCGRDLSEVSTTRPNTTTPTPNAPPKKRLGCMGALLAFALVLGAIMAIGRLAETPKKTVDLPPVAPIRAEVSFTGTQFVVKNAGDDPWLGTTFHINPGVVDKGFFVEAGTVAPGQTVTVGALQFANSDGQRFNPFQLKPQSFRVNASADGQRQIRDFKF